MLGGSLSVIISHCPGREENLKGCLYQLTQQLIMDRFEVIVVDDGSRGGEAVTQAFADQLSLHYLMRPNDLCPARSRNWGAQVAQGELLVFLDADILLNPQALAAYQGALTMRQHWLIYGYYGYQRKYCSFSALRPNQPVNWLDMRFPFDQNDFLPIKGLYVYPYEWAWGGNFALHRELFYKLGGFNEDFVGWGGEDTDFATRACLQGAQIHFSLDAWGEHQAHPPGDDPFQARGQDRTGLPTWVSPQQPVEYPVQVFASPASRRELLQTIYQQYIPQDRYLIQRDAQNEPS